MALGYRSDQSLPFVFGFVTQAFELHRYGAGHQEGRNSGQVAFLSDRYPLHNLTGDLLVPPVVELGGTGVSVAGEALDVFKRDALCEQVGDDGDAEGVRREFTGQGSVAEVAFHHAGDIVGAEGLFAGGGEILR